MVVKRQPREPRIHGSACVDPSSALGFGPHSPTFAAHFYKTWLNLCTRRLYFLSVVRAVGQTQVVDEQETVVGHSRRIKHKVVSPEQVSVLRRHEVRDFQAKPDVAETFSLARGTVVLGNNGWRTRVSASDSALSILDSSPVVPCSARNDDVHPIDLPGPFHHGRRLRFPVEL